MLFSQPIAVAAISTAGLALWPQDDPLRQIRSKDPTDREIAAKALASIEAAKAEAALIKAATKDEDVQVVLAAIQALSSRASSERIEDALVEIALDSPYARVWTAAAESVGLSNPAVARDEFLAAASGKTFVRATRALSVSSDVLTDPVEFGDDLGRTIRRLEKGLRSKDPRERTAAARALVCTTRGAGETRDEILFDLLTERVADSQEIETVCAVLEAIAAAPDTNDATLLTSLVQREDLSSVVERRLEHALERAIACLDSTGQSEVIRSLLTAGAACAGPRLARVLAGDELQLDARAEGLSQLLSKSDAATRAAASKALISLGDRALPLARTRVVKEKSAGARVQLIRALEQIAKGKSVPGDRSTGPATLSPIDAAIGEVLDRASEDRVRATAAVALGRKGAHARSIARLAQLASADSGERVRVVALIALGRTREEGALSTLLQAAGDASWQVRAAAAEGLKQFSAPASVEPLLAMLDDEHSAAAATAHHALLRLAGRELQTVDPGTWPDWWKDNSERANFRTKEEENELNERYGYGVPDGVIYKGLDVIVVPGSGDHIEGVLDRLGIQYRVARAGTLAEAGLHPAAVLLVGCTGDVQKSDLEVIRWYVRSGGALFSSCWALTYTVEASFPAIITRFPSPGQVLDKVYARPTVSGLGSPYLRGVFDDHVQPFYALEGAHLIHVVDPERAEVLLDSPAAAARHGSGDLAAWFRMGHGICFNSANHFDEQGFSSAQGLDKPIDRQAFAVNHMGYSLVQLRATQDERWWSSTSKAAKEVSDLSVFRILTNFVRKKRMDG